jgi:hypothetical protein
VLAAKREGDAWPFPVVSGRRPAGRRDEGAAWLHPARGHSAKILSVFGSSASRPARRSGQRRIRPGARGVTWRELACPLLAGAAGTRGRRATRLRFVKGIRSWRAKAPRLARRSAVHRHRRHAALEALLQHLCVFLEERCVLGSSSAAAPPSDRPKRRLFGLAGAPGATWRERSLSTTCARSRRARAIRAQTRLARALIWEGIGSWRARAP